MNVINTEGLALYVNLYLPLWVPVTLSNYGVMMAPSHSLNEELHQPLWISLNTVCPSVDKCFITRPLPGLSVSYQPPD